MPKMPWVKWFPQDWLGEPALRSAPLEIKGAWADALNEMLAEGVCRLTKTPTKPPKCLLCGLRMARIGCYHLICRRNACLMWNLSLTDGAYAAFAAKLRAQPQGKVLFTAWMPKGKKMWCRSKRNALCKLACRYEKNCRPIEVRAVMKGGGE